MLSGWGRRYQSSEDPAEEELGVENSWFIIVDVRNIQTCREV